MQKSLKEKISKLMDMVIKLECEEDTVEFKRMAVFPDGSVFFLTRDESDDLMEECTEMGLIEIPGTTLFVVFDEDNVIEYQGRRYICGPVLVRCALIPEYESDLTREEIRRVFDELEANETTVPLGWEKIPVFALGEGEPHGTDDQSC